MSIATPHAPTSEAFTAPIPSSDLHREQSTNDTSETHKSEFDSQSSTREAVGPVSFLANGVRLGKAVVKAAVEHERDSQEQIRDRIKAAENVAANAYASTFGGNVAGAKEKKQKGDEALPPVKEGDGQPPEVVYSHGALV